MKNIILKLMMIVLTIVIIMHISFYSYAAQTIEEEAAAVYNVFNLFFASGTKAEDASVGGKTYTVSEARSVLEKAIDGGNLDAETKKKYIDMYSAEVSKGGLGGGDKYNSVDVDVEIDEDTTLEAEAEDIYEMFKMAYYDRKAHPDDTTIINGKSYSVSEARAVIKKAIEEGNLDDATKEKYMKIYLASTTNGGFGGSEEDFLTEEEREIIRTAKEAAEAAGQDSANEFLQDQYEQGNISEEALNVGKESVDKSYNGTSSKDKETTISGTVIMGSTDDPYTDGDLDDPRNTPDSYKPEGVSEDAERLKEIGSIIIASLRVVGVVVAVVTLIALGFKYMAGSVSEKAEYKKTMIPYLIGAFILLVGTQIVGILYDLVENIN